MIESPETLSNSLQLKDYAASPIWEQLYMELESESHREALCQLHEWLSGDNNAVSRYLVTGNKKPANLDMQRYMRDLVALRGNEPGQLELWTELINRLVTIGTDKRIWTLSTSPVLVRADREKGLITPARFKHFGDYAAWQTILNASIASQWELTPEGKRGQLYLSAVLNGGLVSTHLLVGLSQCDHESCEWHHSVLTVNLVLAWQGHQNVEFRRWLPDPLSELLLLRSGMLSAPKEPLRHDKAVKQISDCIKHFFREVGKRGEAPANVRRLMDATKLQYDIRLPVFFSHYIGRRYRCHSLKSGAWRRLQYPGHGGVNAVGDALSELDQWPTSKAKPEDDHAASVLEGNWVKQLRKIAASDTNAQIKDALRETLREPSLALTPIGESFTRWLMELVDTGRRKYRELKPSTIRRYVGSVAVRLDEAFGGEQLLDLGEDDFSDAYTAILDDLGSNSQRKIISRVLYDFHRFMVDRYYLPAIDYDGILGAHSAPSTVDANIIWPDEFERLIVALTDSKLIMIHPDLVTTTKLVAILGYRCGLRRSEALMLRLEDIHGWQDTRLLVRPHKERRLKTIASQRQLPLDVLMEPAELDMFKRWCDKRERQERESPYSNYLFAIPDKQYYCVSAELIFPAIHKAMRAVSGDQSLRYHHFRHSFATLNLLRLMVADYGCPPNVFDSLPVTRKWLESSRSFSRELHRIDGPTRKHLFYIAALLGHSLPDVSLEHYIHGLDVMAAHIRDQLFPIDDRLLIEACGLPESSAYRQLKKGRQHFFNWVRKKYHLNRSQAENTTVTQDQTEDGTGDSIHHWVSLQENWEILYLHSAHNVSKERLSDRYNRLSDEVSTLVSNAEALRELKAKNHKDRLRFRMMEQEGERLLCPIAPRKRVDQEFAKKLAISLGKLKEQDVESYKKFLELYKNHAWKTRYVVVFRDPECARVFLNTLKEAGIDQASLLLTVLHGRNASEQSVAGAVKAWSKGLDSLAVSNRITPRVLGTSHADRSIGSLGVNVSVDPAQIGGDGVIGNTESFRYVMTMQLISNN